MESRSRLVYVPGIPFRSEALMPQWSLAMMAGCLLDAGHQTRILDWGAVSAMRRFGGPGLRAAAAHVAALRDREPGPMPGGRFAGLWQLRALEALYQESLHARRADVIDEMAKAGELDFVVFLIHTRDDLREALQVGTWLRERTPGIRQLAAGVYIEDYGVVVLSATDVFDCALVGDVEISLPALARRIHRREHWAGVPNLLYREDGRVVQTDCEAARDLDSLSPPRYDLEAYPALRGGQKFNLFTLEHSRGRSNVGYGDAAFPWPAQRVRVKSPHALRMEMRVLTSTLGARAFHLEGEQTPGAQVNRLAYELLARPMPIEYSRSAHMAYTDAAAVRNLAASGCRAIGFRLGTGSQRLLDDFYGYDFSVSGAEHVLCACRQADLFAAARFFYPCPQDDYHTREETLRLVDRGSPHAVNVSAPPLRPRSAWWQQPLDFGYRVDLDAYARWVTAADAKRPCLGREEDLPYRMAGWSRSRRIAAQKDFMRVFEEERGVPALSEQEAFIARLAGYEGQEGAFAARLRRSLFTADGRDIAELVARFNSHATVAANTAVFRPFRPALAAVGN